MVSLPDPLRRLLKASSRNFDLPRRAARVRFGNLRRLAPISRAFGKDRGRPIDRYYIERFLADQAADIRGHVLEIGYDTYTKSFGGHRVIKSDVLHVMEGNPKATIVADLIRADHIPADTFDCIILTQTLQFIYDVEAALKTLYRILKPGGILLATFGGISQISRWDMDRWGHYWNFTTLSARRLFEESFPAAKVKVDAYGNVLAAIALLHGLATQELRQEELDHRDPDYEVLITVRAVKPDMPN
jgi:SAM-dependent methyltransferase